MSPINYVFCRFVAFKDDAIKMPEVGRQPSRGSNVYPVTLLLPTLALALLFLSLSLHLGSESHNTYQWTRHGHGSCPSPSATWPAQQFIWKFNLLGRTKWAKWAQWGVQWGMATGAGNETEWSIRLQPHVKINIIRLAPKKKRNK